MNAGERVYLDYNATAPLLPAAREAMARAFDLPGNPSSVHAEGRASRAAIETAREQVAALAGASPSRIIFVSGATEAAALALSPGLTLAGRGFDLLLAGAGEHACILESHGFPATSMRKVALTASGILDLKALRDALAGLTGFRPILALQAANNETGAIQPVAEAAALVHEAGGILVCDAVQGVHRFDCSAAALGADAIFFSAHKLGGPKGAGALVLANPALEIGVPLIRGGGQERGQRAGTENVAAIAGFGAAAVAALAIRDSEAGRLRALRAGFETGLRQLFPDAAIFAEDAPRLDNTCAFAIPGMAAETLLIGLDLAGIALSSGSACSSGKVKASHVLESMGAGPDLIKGAMRASLGWRSTLSDIERALAALEKVAGGIAARRLKSAA